MLECNNKTFVKQSTYKLKYLFVFMHILMVNRIGTQKSAGKQESLRISKPGMHITKRARSWNFSILELLTFTVVM